MPDGSRNLENNDTASLLQSSTTQEQSMDVVANLPLKNGECPVWNPKDACVYWSDIPTGRMFRYAMSDEDWELVYTADRQLGALVVARDGSIIQGLENGRVQRWKEGKTSLICDSIAEEQGRRFNDATVDPVGRILIGTMPGKDKPASLYSFDLDGSYRVLMDDIGESNGMAFSDDGKILYHTDTGRKQIAAYEYDQKTGDLGNCEVLIEVHEDDVVPDGLNMDSLGRIWSAHWGGGEVACYRKGVELERLKVPVPRVSSVAFGGPDLNQMFITTAGGDNRSHWGQFSGSLFCEQLPFKGKEPLLAAVHSPLEDA